MAKNWNVTVAGRERYISVEPAESGREVIRLDGRTAARPLTDNDQERVFEIDGERYAIRRAPDGFSIQPMPESRSVDTFIPAAARVQAIAAPDRRLTKMTRYWWVV